MFYSDLNQVNPTQDSLVEDLDAIYQSIANILTTQEGERLFNPEFGSKLDDLLFAPIDDTTSETILSYLVDAIERWDPRVVINYDESVIEPFPDDLKYEVVLSFKVKGYPEQAFRFSGLLAREV